MVECELRLIEAAFNSGQKYYYIVNSPFNNQIFHPYRSPIGHMRLIDRDRAEKASSHTMTIDDWEMIKTSPGF